MTNKNDNTPISKKNPIPNILTKLNIESSKSFNSKTKKTIRSSNENNKNQPEKPSKRAYLLEINEVTCIKIILYKVEFK